MLRVAAAVRAELGRDAIGPIVTAYGQSLWDRAEGSDVWDDLGTPGHAVAVLAAAGVPTTFADALDDESWDPALDEETELALSRTGREVGTPIISFRPPDGPSFFGPVISRVPDDADVLRLWESVVTLATFPGFSELKRSLREVPQVPLLGGAVDEPAMEDWEGGHRRVHLA